LRCKRHDRRSERSKTALGPREITQVGRSGPNPTGRTTTRTRWRNSREVTELFFSSRVCSLNHFRPSSCRVVEDFAHLYRRLGFQSSNLWLDITQGGPGHNQDHANVDFIDHSKNDPGCCCIGMRNRPDQSGENHSKVHLKGLLTVFEMRPRKPAFRKPPFRVRKRTTFHSGSQHRCHSSGGSVFLGLRSMYHFHCLSANFPNWHKWQKFIHYDHLCQLCNMRVFSTRWLVAQRICYSCDKKLTRHADRDISHLLNRFRPSCDGNQNCEPSELFATLWYLYPNINARDFFHVQGVRVFPRTLSHFG
jgi:hypothetical protein